MFLDVNGYLLTWEGIQQLGISEGEEENIDQILKILKEGFDSERLLKKEQFTERELEELEEYAESICPSDILFLKNLIP